MGLVHSNQASEAKPKPPHGSIERALVRTTSLPTLTALAPAGRVRRGDTKNRFNASLPVVILTAGGRQFSATTGSSSFFIQDGAHPRPRTQAAASGSSTRRHRVAAARQSHGTGLPIPRTNRWTNRRDKPSAMPHPGDGGATGESAMLWHGFTRGAWKTSVQRQRHESAPFTQGRRRRGTQSAKRRERHSLLGFGWDTGIVPQTSAVRQVNQANCHAFK